MTNEEIEVIYPENETSLVVLEPEGDLVGDELDFDLKVTGPDILEMVGTVLQDMQQDLRKRIIEWATRLVVQETSDLLKSNRRLPRYESHRPKNNHILDFDLDSTIDNFFENPKNKYDAIRVLNRVKSGHSVLLIIDSSFSMSKHKLVMAAAAASTVCHLFDSSDIAVVHFGTKAKIMKHFDDVLSPESLVEQIFGLSPKGLTNIYQAMKVSIEELGDRKQSKYTVILLSDCDLNCGKMPTFIAWKLQGLKIITFPPVNEFIADLLKKETRGAVFHAVRVKDIPLILRNIFN